MKGVFTTRIDPSYDDLPEVQYHFPKTYLIQIQKSVGDLILYYEPGRTGGKGSRRDGRMSYFAVAEVTSIIPDNRKDGHYYALIQNYLEFDTPVHFRDGDRTHESGLQKDDGSYNKGAFRRAVRNISNADFESILAAGFRTDLPDFVPEFANLETIPMSLQEDATEFERPLVEVTLRRAFRDKAFSRKVRQAYDRRCAFTGLKILNGFGRPEVQAAHIQPVKDNGPDSIRNGLALSSTIHWMFDRGLMSLRDNFEFLMPTNSVPLEVAKLLNKDGKAILPANAADQPHKRFLEYHRDEIFKG